MSVSWTPVWDLFCATLLREPPALLLAIVVGIAFVLAMALEGIHVSLTPKRFVRRHPHLHPEPPGAASSLPAPAAAVAERPRLKPRWSNPKKRIPVVKKKSGGGALFSQGRKAVLPKSRSEGGPEGG